MNALEKVYADPSYRKFMEIVRTTEIPAFVKEASMEDDYDSMSGQLYADPAHRRYPLNNKANTWLSREYFMTDRKDYEPRMAALIEGRISKAAEYWQVGPAKKLTAQDPDECSVWAVHQGKPVYEVKITCGKHYKEAAEHLYNNRHAMTYDMRRSMARGLHNVPAALRSDIPADIADYLEKAAGFGMATPSIVQKTILARVVHVYRTAPELSQGLVKTAEAYKDMEVTPENLHKLAGVLDIIDRAVDLHRYYGHGHSTPEESLFQITQKMAKAVTDEGVRLANGRIVSRTALLNRRLDVDDFFRSYAGEVPYKTPEEMTDIVSSLPRGDADALLNTIGDIPELK